MRRSGVVLLLAMLVGCGGNGLDTEPGTLRGRTVTAQDDPLAGVEVLATGDNGLIHRATSDASGVYTLPLSEGTYRLRALIQRDYLGNTATMLDDLILACTAKGGEPQQPVRQGPEGVDQVELVLADELARGVRAPQEVAGEQRGHQRVLPDPVGRRLVVRQRLPRTRGVAEAVHADVVDSLGGEAAVGGRQDLHVGAALPQPGDHLHQPRGDDVLRVARIGGDDVEGLHLSARGAASNFIGLQIP